MEKNPKSPFSVIMPERFVINRKLHGIEQSLQQLATANDASLAAASEEPVDKIRKRLLEERATLTDKLETVGPESVRPRRASSAPVMGGPGPREERLKSGFSRMFPDFMCEPTASENINLLPTDFGCDFFSVEGFSYSEFMNTGFEVSSPPASMVARFQIRDPNSDPFNSDLNAVMVAPWWRYQLPERAFNSRYDLSLSALINIDVTGFSNNIFGNWFWGSWINGFLALQEDGGGIPLDFSSPIQQEIVDGRTVDIGEKPIHDYFATPNYNSGQVGMNRSVDVTADDAPPEAVLGFPLLFWIDRGTLDGLVRINQGDNAAALACTITQIV